MLSPEDHAFITECRLKSEAGTITLEEQKRAVLLLRAGRVAAVEAAAKARAPRASKPTKVKISTDDALAELEAMGL
jgi:hypothetical protein